jgi:hypothetical protein
VADTGSADPALAAALEQWQAEPGPRTRARVLAAVSSARLFAAVTARSTAEHLEAGTGLRAESTAEMSLVTLAGTTGRGLPAFLDVPSVTAFVDGARPVRASAQEICQAALDDGAAAVVVDPTGAGLVLSGSELAELAAGRTPVAGAGGLSTRRTAAALSTPERPDRELLAALRVALRQERVTARLLDGPDGPVLGVLGMSDPAQLAALAARLQPRLPRPLDLTAVPRRGPGIAIEPRRLWLRRGR